jgi:hypothetical protein
MENTYRRPGMGSERGIEDENQHGDSDEGYQSGGMITCSAIATIYASCSLRMKKYIHHA